MQFVIRWLGPALTLTFAVALTGVVALVSQEMGRRIDPDTHWSVRNREITQGRMAVLGATLLTLAVPFGAALVFVGQFSAISEFSAGLAGSLCGLIGSVVIIRRFNECHLNLPMFDLTARERRTSALYRTFYFSLIVLPVILLMRPASVLSVAIQVACVAIVAVLTVTAERVWAELGLTRPLPVSHHHLAIEAGIEPERVMEIRARAPNAMALTSGRIGVTTGLLGAMPDDQAIAILHHELGHESHLAFHKRARNLQLVGIVAALFALARFVATTSLLYLVVGLTIVVCLGLAGNRIQARSRQFESHADRSAVAGSDGTTFARGLARIADLGGLPATHKGGTHPTIYDRMVTAGLEPDFPRPDPPRSSSLFLGMVPVAVVAIAVLLLAKPTSALLGPRAEATFAVATRWDDDLYLAYAEAAARAIDPSIMESLGQDFYADLSGEPEYHRHAVDAILAASDGCLIEYTEDEFFFDREFCSARPDG